MICVNMYVAIFFGSWPGLGGFANDITLLLSTHPTILSPDLSVQKGPVSNNHPTLGLIVGGVG